MPRCPRIEFEGAVYHVMARGNHLNKIVFSDGDCRMFISTLNQIAEKTGWEIFCWVLMSNHYHLVFRTPKANLVEGMSWFQKTFTQRINARNRLRGHLFAGRYKAILVENEDLAGKSYNSDYLSTLINYVHLNPGRAGLVNGSEDSILDYHWSSLSEWYGKPASKRPESAQVSEGLDLLQYKDSISGRRSYVRDLDEVIRAETAEKIGVWLPEQQSLQSTLERGWYWGSQVFQESVMSRFSKAMEKGSKGRNEKASAMSKDHSEKKAEGIVKLAKDHFGMGVEDLRKTVSGDRIRPAIAVAIAGQTTLSQKRIAEILNMKSAANVSQQICKFKKTPIKGEGKSIRQFLKKSRMIT